MRSKPSIIFFTPGFKVGGTNILYARLAEQLVAAFDLDITVIDYPDGFVAKQLKQRSVHHRLVGFDPNHPVTLPPDSCLVLELSHAFFVDRWFADSDQIRCLLWSLHPANSLVSFSLNPLYKGLKPEQTARLITYLDASRKQKIRQMLFAAHATQSLFFMDLENYYWNRVIFGFDSNPYYLPVPTVEDRISTQHSAGFHHSGRLHVGWLGRLATDKIASLRALIESLNHYANLRGKQIVLHVIGNGSKESVLDRLPFFQRLQLVRCGTLIGDELAGYLSHNIDILFGMGTSALDAARLEIPTVLVPFDYHNIPLQHFNLMWLNTSPDYLLGWHWTNPLVQNLQPLTQILDRVINDETTLIQIGRECREYAMSRHGLSSVADQLLTAIASGGKFTLRDIRTSGVLDSTPIEQVLSWLKRQYQMLRRATASGRSV